VGNKSNSEEILKIFWDIEHEDQNKNYFALRESMKLEYKILKQHENLRKEFVKRKEYLKMCMQFLGQESDMITFEALQLLSIFLNEKLEEQSIVGILHKNAGQLMEFVDKFVL